MFLDSVSGAMCTSPDWLIGTGVGGIWIKPSGTVSSTCSTTFNALLLSTFSSPASLFTTLTSLVGSIIGISCEIDDVISKLGTLVGGE